MITADEVVAASHPLRILGLSEGAGPMALSGIPGHLFDALDRQFATVQRLDYSPGGPERLGLAAATFRPSRSAWRARFHTSRRAHGVLSATLSTRVEVDARPFDIALQVLGWVRNQPEPYALYVDQTRLMAERGWPSWMPLVGRERGDILGLEREMYASAAHVFAMGHPALDSLVADYGADVSRITVVGGGLNLADLPAPHLAPAEPNVLFVGRDFERKGGDRLLEAFRIVRQELPNAALHIVGVGRSFRQAGVVNHGEVSDRGRLAALYKTARAFCMPSRYEPWGLVFPEAMSYGVPCLGSTVQSIPEILDHGKAGLLVSPEDTDGLAAALLELLTDDGLARQIGAAGRRRVEAVHTWDHVARRMKAALVGAARGSAS